MSKILAEDWPELTEDIERLKVQAALGIAWQEAEALAREKGRRLWAGRGASGYTARADPGEPGQKAVKTFGPDLASALRAIAARLREQP
jgi:hypothetical protein